MTKTFYGTSLSSPLMLGTAQYPSPAILADAFTRSKASVATVSLRREASTNKAGQDFWQLVQSLNVKILPNTAGCHSVKEAVTTAHMAREVFNTSWIKLEVIANDDTLQPEVFGLVEAATESLGAAPVEEPPIITRDETGAPSPAMTALTSGRF